jgi:hypothetical protein
MCDCCPISRGYGSCRGTPGFPTGELDAIVGDDGVRHPEPVDDVSEEQHDLFGPKVGSRACLNPFRELVDCDQQVPVAPRAPSAGARRCLHPIRQIAM